MDNLLISPALPAHTEAILAIQSECGLSPWTRLGYLDEMKRPDSIFLVAQNSQDTVGFIVGRVIEQDADSEAEIYNIGTLPTFQHQGFGARLLLDFITICRQRDVSVIWLEVRESNKKAVSFYKAHGFVRAGHRPSFYSNPVENAEVMCLLL